MTLSSLSAEYILFACDDDYEMAEKICRRLNGLRLTPSIRQMNKLKAQKMLIEGQGVHDIAEALEMQLVSVYKIRREMVRDGLTYYYGESKDDD